MRSTTSHTAFTSNEDPAPTGIGVNRNLLVDNRSVDPLSGTAAFNDTFVAVVPVRDPQEPISVRTASSGE